VGVFFGYFWIFLDIFGYFWIFYGIENQINSIGNCVSSSLFLLCFLCFPRHPQEKMIIENTCRTFDKTTRFVRSLIYDGIQQGKALMVPS
jgi:hypothetical protein